MFVTPPAHPNRENLLIAVSDVRNVNVQYMVTHYLHYSFLPEPE